MLVNTIESVGVCGMKVELSLQNCIVLKSLVTELAEVKEYLEKRNSDQNVHRVVNAMNFINKITGDIISLDDAGKEMFEVPQTNNEL